MIAVVYGTTGELIKLAPVLVALRNQGVPVATLCTGQQVEQIPTLLDDFGLAQPDIWLARGYRGHDLESIRDLPPWLGSVVKSFVRHRRSLQRRFASAQTNSLIIVHGDTFTTVIGALIGRTMGTPVAHIEAGLRSGDWRNPFPEELDRLVTSRLARIHLAPGAHAAANLHASNVRGEIVDTGGNTIRDALDLVPDSVSTIELPDGEFGVVSLHRFELLSKPIALREILELLYEASRRTPLLFIDHPVTAAAISAQGLDALFDERLRRVPRQRYFPFIALLKASSFLITDSGGSQEECAQLGHPCLVHRLATERPDGLGGPVVLSRMSLQVVRAFLADPPSYATRPVADQPRPTDIIIRYLQRRGFLADPVELATPTVP